MAQAGLYNFTIEQGADWRTSFRFTDANGDPISLVDAIITFAARFNVDDESPAIEATSVANDGIVITDEADGVFAMNRVAYDTIQYPIGLLLYNYEINSPTIGKIRFLDGQVTVSPDVNY